jgi:hypothetical protein
MKFFLTTILSVGTLVAIGATSPLAPVSEPSLDTLVDRGIRDCFFPVLGGRPNPEASLNNIWREWRDRNGNLIIARNQNQFPERPAQSVWPFRNIVGSRAIQLAGLTFEVQGLPGSTVPWAYIRVHNTGSDARRVEFGFYGVSGEWVCQGNVNVPAGTPRNPGSVDTNYRLDNNPDRDYEWRLD